MDAGSAPCDGECAALYVRVPVLRLGSKALTDARYCDVMDSADTGRLRRSPVQGQWFEPLQPVDLQLRGPERMPPPKWPDCG
jgi:hypothetical protein